MEYCSMSTPCTSYIRRSAPIGAVDRVKKHDLLAAIGWFLLVVKVSKLNVTGPEMFGTSGPFDAGLMSCISRLHPNNQ